MDLLTARGSMMCEASTYGDTGTSRHWSSCRPAAAPAEAMAELMGPNEPSNWEPGGTALIPAAPTPAPTPTPAPAPAPGAPVSAVPTLN